MSTFGAGYGSEWHLLRWLGWHRDALNEQLLNAYADGSAIHWMDFHFQPGEARRFGTNGQSRAFRQPFYDAERTRLDFLSGATQAAFNAFWPGKGRGQSWDAVGWLTRPQERVLLLVEAKAHVDELISDCGAKHPGSVARIDAAFAQVKSALGAPATADWKRTYYQQANRLAVLWFLNEQQGIPAKLVHIYFHGDVPSTTRDCPQSEDEWAAALCAMDDHLLGRTGAIPDDWVVNLHLHVGGP